MFLVASSMFILNCRFRVESTDITQGDVRIKEIDITAAAAVPDKAKSMPPTPKSDSPKSTAMDKMMRKDSKKNNSQHSSQKRRNFSRSQSVTAPKPPSAKPPEPSFSFKCTSLKQGSFSTMSAADLEDWKLSVLNPTSSSSQFAMTTQQDEPILTVASSSSDSSNVTVGFDVEEKKE